MDHSKLPLKVIQCNKRRKSAFSKRIKGLKKKAAELATLCGIDVCMVCCDPNGDPLETWPGSLSEVLPIIERYKKITKTGRKGSITDVSSMLEDKIKKLQQDLDRKQAENKLILYPSWDHQLDGMSEGSLRELVGQLDMKLEKLRERIEMVKSSSDERRLNMVRTEQELVKKDCNAPLPLSYLTPLHHLYMSSQNLGFNSNMVQNEQEHLVEEDCNAPPHVSYLTPFYHLDTNSQNLGINSDMGSEMPMLNGDIISGNSHSWMGGFQDFVTNEYGIEMLSPISNELDYAGFPLLGLEPQDSVGLLNIEQMEYENDISFQIPNRLLGSLNSVASFL